MVKKYWFIKKGPDIGLRQHMSAKFGSETNGTRIFGFRRTGSGIFGSEKEF
jgi:hypothetical protein